jgi:uracil-DNA glycosylase
MMETWEDLTYWRSGEWQVIEERLDDLEKANEFYCPRREHLFRALDETPLKEVKVLFMGQDPYPTRTASGLAFDVPAGAPLPPTLVNIFDEYESDLHYPRPQNGELITWAKQGVLLWNAVPSCLLGTGWSHNWPEWKVLTAEIIEVLREKGIVFVFIGHKARSFASMVNDYPNCKVIEVNHPSPRAQMTAKQKASGNGFKGSRLFTRINESLTELGLSPIEWRLPCETSVESSKKRKGRVKILVAPKDVTIR